MVLQTLDEHSLTHFHDRVDICGVQEREREDTGSLKGRDLPRKQQKQSKESLCWDLDSEQGRTSFCKGHMTSFFLGLSREKHHFIKTTWCSSEACFHRYCPNLPGHARCLSGKDKRKQ